MRPQSPFEPRRDAGRHRRQEEDFDERDEAARFYDRAGSRGGGSRGEYRYGQGYDPDRERNSWAERDESMLPLREQRPYRGLGYQDPEQPRYPSRDFAERDSYERGFDRDRAYRTLRDEEDMRERGHAAGQGARRYGAAPRGYQRSDERVREDVCDALMDRAELDASDVEVKVHDGEVTLEGTVRDRRQKLTIEHVCDRVLGVKDVDNRLRVRREQERTGGGGDSMRSATSSPDESRATGPDGARTPRGSRS